MYSIASLNQLVEKMTPALERLRDYFQSIADELAIEAKKIAVLENAGDIGGEREAGLKNFLGRHLPNRCEVIKGGFIFDQNGNESNQMDLIITNDITLQFKQNDKAFNCIEGCYGAISVKSKLDKEKLGQALSDIASIPPMPDRVDQISPFLHESHITEYHSLPYKVIFAYSGIEVKTIQQHLNHFFASSQVPLNRRPDLIIVNNKYMLVNPHTFPILSSTGQPLGQNHWGVVESNPYVGGMALLLLITRLQYVANFSPFVLFTFSEYHDAIAKLTWTKPSS